MCIRDSPNPYYVQPYGIPPAAAQGYPAIQALPPPQQAASVPGPPYPGQQAITGPPSSTYMAQATGQMQLLPQAAWRESNVSQFMHSNFTVSPHSARRTDVDYVRLLELVNSDDYLKHMFTGRHEMLIPLLQRHYFQSVLSSMVYTRGGTCLLYTSPSPRDRTRSRMPSSA